MLRINRQGHELAGNDIDHNSEVIINQFEQIFNSKIQNVFFGQSIGVADVVELSSSICALFDVGMSIDACWLKKKQSIDY